jgi:hypothetical protein
MYEYKIIPLDRRGQPDVCEKPQHLDSQIQFNVGDSLCYYCNVNGLAYEAIINNIEHDGEAIRLFVDITKRQETSFRPNTGTIIWTSTERLASVKIVNDIGQCIGEYSAKHANFRQNDSIHYKGFKYKISRITWNIISLFEPICILEVQSISEIQYTPEVTIGLTKKEIILDDEFETPTLPNPINNDSDAQTDTSILNSLTHGLSETAKAKLQTEIALIQKNKDKGIVYYLDKKFLNTFNMTRRSKTQFKRGLKLFILNGINRLMGNAAVPIAETVWKAISEKIQEKLKNNWQKKDRAKAENKSMHIYEQMKAATHFEYQRLGDEMPVKYWKVLKGYQMLINYRDINAMSDYEFSIFRKDYLTFYTEFKEATEALAFLTMFTDYMKQDFKAIEEIFKEATVKFKHRVNKLHPDSKPGFFQRGSTTTVHNKYRIKPLARA